MYPQAELRDTIFKEYIFHVIYRFDFEFEHCDEDFYIDNYKKYINDNYIFYNEEDIVPFYLYVGLLEPIDKSKSFNYPLIIFFNLVNNSICNPISHHESHYRLIKDTNPIELWGSKDNFFYFQNPCLIPLNKDHIYFNDNYEEKISDSVRLINMVKETLEKNPQYKYKTDPRETEKFAKSMYEINKQAFEGINNSEENNNKENDNNFLDQLFENINKYFKDKEKTINPNENKEQTPIFFKKLEFELETEEVN